MSKSLDEIIEGFDPSEPMARAGSSQSGIVTFRLSPEYKEKYDKLQQTSGRRFCKKVRELIQAAIDFTEARAS